MKKTWSKANVDINSLKKLLNQTKTSMLKVTMLIADVYQLLLFIKHQSYHLCCLNPQSLDSKRKPSLSFWRLYSFVGMYQTNMLDKL